ncbi:cuticle protein-like [Tribolium madens]|uniref:cuticle protein-like n=1 Tax=Tribolium madens TaxID=41895 RepID=UPI001CF73F9B|nr:cuticle protein-like [Tribolium madens]
MAYKFVALSALFAYASAGIVSAPATLAAAPISYAAPVAHTYAAPVAHTYAAPIARAYAAPIARAYAAPIAPIARYAAPIARYAAPVARYAAPVAVAHAAPVAVAHAAPVAVSDEYDPHPQYSYGYDIQDGLTGDSKNQQETRDGDVVQGSYSLTDPDGTRRTVEYTADPINGFNAVVHKEPLVAKVAAPVAYAAPVARVAAPVAYAAPVAKVAAPLAYAAPVAKVAFAAPIARFAAPVAVAHAAPVVAHAAPVAVAHAAPVAVSDEYDPHPQYSYGYDIQDGLTGDSKNQHETRDGDVVHGSYSLTDPDGTRRTVEYTADPINGFNAVVHKEPLVAKVAAPVAVAPAIARVAAPVAYAAPIAKVHAPLAYAAPVAKVHAPLAYSTSVFH